MNARLWDAICLVVLCVTLALGLWPFQAPKNEVAWLETRNGIRFAKHGGVFSAAPLQPFNGRAARPPVSRSGCSLAARGPVERF